MRLSGSILGEFGMLQLQERPNRRARARPRLARGGEGFDPSAEMLLYRKLGVSTIAMLWPSLTGSPRAALLVGAFLEGP